MNVQSMHKYSICPSNNEQRTNTVCLQFPPLSCLQTPLNSMTKQSKMLSRHSRISFLYHTLYTLIRYILLYVIVQTIYMCIMAHSVCKTHILTPNYANIRFFTQCSRQAKEKQRPGKEKKTTPEPLASYITMTKLCVIACPIHILHTISTQKYLCRVYIKLRLLE